MSPDSEESVRDASLLVSFWSVEQRPSRDRYHVGHLSITRYIDNRVDQGASHLAIICDSDTLGQPELDRIYEVSAAISSMCEQPVSIRTLTSLRSGMSMDLTRAHRVESQLKNLEMRASQRSASSADSIQAIIRSWKDGKITSEELLNSLNFLSTTETELLNADEASGLVCLLLSRPGWYDTFWFASAQFAINQISSAELGSVEAIEIVEALRNRYVWLARQALEKLFPNEFPKRGAGIKLNVRPNVAADGPSGFMCLKESDFALFLKSPNEVISRFCDSSTERVATSICREVLNRGEETDRRRLALETIVLLENLQRRWIQGGERIGASRLAPPPAAKISKTIVSIHGIVSTGSWQLRLTAALAKAGQPSTPAQLGYLWPSVLPFRGIANKKAAELVEQIHNAMKSTDTELPSVVAHSFGTLVLGVALENLQLRVDKVVLHGSILRRSFPWSQLLESRRVGCVVNMVSPHDTVVPLAGPASLGRCGPSGTKGFTDKHARLVQPITPDFGHSDLLTVPFFMRNLIPFLMQNGEDIRSFFADYESVDGPNPKT